MAAHIHLRRELQFRVLVRMRTSHLRTRRFPSQLRTQLSKFKLRTNYSRTCVHNLKWGIPYAYLRWRYIASRGIFSICGAERRVHAQSHLRCRNILPVLSLTKCGGKWVWTTKMTIDIILGNYVVNKWEHF